METIALSDDSVCLAFGLTPNKSAGAVEFQATSVLPRV